jgi:endonuclease/exonuclease/phosphatase family metal-dependent hydrolase
MMSKVFFNKTICTVVLLISLLDMIYSQQDEQTKVMMMFYNVENLFDINKDSSKNDIEFLPDGLRRWNSSRYYKKLNSLFRAIVSGGEWGPPEIIGFAEIENRKVIEDLINNTYLSRYSYGIIHEESPDKRGIDVGLIFRKDIVNVLSYDSWIPRGYTKDNFFTRTVLYVKCAMLGDTVHILVNHWPSKLGGALANESLRLDVAEMIREKADSIALVSDEKAKIVILGDFNCTWNDKEMKILTNSGVNNINGTRNRFINLSEKPAKNGIGSYRYQGIWELIDQVIVSEYFINCEVGLYTNEDFFKVNNSDFLLTNDSKYPGKTPFSTFLGYRYQGGYSDHLPVLLEIRVR